MTTDSLISTASVISGFSVAVLMFRISREVAMEEKDQKKWIPWADYLILSVILLSLLFVVLPLCSISTNHHPHVMALASASCGASTILLAAYPFAILDHYRIGVGSKRTKPRERGEPIEKFIVISSLILASGTFGVLIASRWNVVA